MSLNNFTSWIFRKSKDFFSFLFGTMPGSAEGQFLGSVLRDHVVLRSKLGTTWYNKANALVCGVFS